MTGGLGAVAVNVCGGGCGGRDGGGRVISMKLDASAVRRDCGRACSGLGSGLVVAWIVAQG